MSICINKTLKYQFNPSLYSQIILYSHIQRLLVDLSTPSAYRSTPSDIEPDGVVFSCQNMYCTLQLGSFSSVASCPNNLTKMLKFSPVRFKKKYLNRKMVLTWCSCDHRNIDIVCLKYKKMSNVPEHVW